MTIGGLSHFSTGWFHWRNATRGHGAKPNTSSEHKELTSTVYDQWAEEIWDTAAQPKPTWIDKSQQQTHNLPLVKRSGYRVWRNFLRTLGHGLSKCVHWLSHLKIQRNAQTPCINHLPAAFSSCNYVAVQKRFGWAQLIYMKEAQGFHRKGVVGFLPLHILGALTHFYFVSFICHGRSRNKLARTI